MREQVRITIDHLIDGSVVKSTIVSEQRIKEVKSIEDLGFNHQQQIDIIKGCQEGLLHAQSSSLKENISCCPQCGAKLKFVGSTSSHFHSVFTDHKVPVKRQKCCNKTCG
jgi:hypothetical protein